MTYSQLYFDFFCEEKEQSRLRRIEADKKAEKYKNRNKNIYDFCKANRNCDCVKTLYLHDLNQILIWNGIHGELVKITNKNRIKYLMEKLAEELITVSVDEIIRKGKNKLAKIRREREKTKRKYMQISLFD